MKRAIILLLALILTAQVLYAVDGKKAYSEYLEPSKTYNTSIMPIFLSPSEDMETMYVKFGKETISLENKTCDVLGIYTLCYDGGRFKRYDTKIDEEVYEFLISIYSSSADVQISKQIDKSDSYPNEESMITVSFQNVGVLIAKDITYEERYPDLELSDSSGCDIQGDLVTSKFDLAPDTTKHCRFYLKSDQPASVTSKGNVSYFNGESETTKKVPESKINILEPELEVALIPSNYSLNVGENLTLNVYVNNTHKTDQINLNRLILRIPDSFRIIKLNLKSSKTEEWKQREDGSLNVEEWVPAKENTTYTLIVRPDTAGNFTINYSGSYKVGSKERPINQTTAISVGIDRLDIFDKSNGTLIAGKANEFQIYLGNRGGKGYVFRDIKVYLSCEGLGINKSFDFEQINPKEFLPVFNERTGIPDMYKNSTSCEISYGYYSDSGQYFSYEKELDYVVIPDKNETKIIQNTTEEFKQAVKPKETFLQSIPGKINDYRIYVFSALIAIAVILAILLFFRHLKSYKRKLELREIEKDEDVQEDEKES